MGAASDRWQREIVELHEFFEGWLGGTLPATDEVFARLAEALAPSFTIVAPDGRLLARDPLLRRLRTAHRSRPGLRIRIERPRQRFASDDVVLGTYEEWQQMPGGPVRGRLSTVLFRRTGANPRGLEWMHVHETWLPEGDP